MNGRHAYLDFCEEGRKTAKEKWLNIDVSNPGSFPVKKLKLVLTGNWESILLSLVSNYILHK